MLYIYRATSYVCPLSIYETFFVYFETVGENTKNSGIIRLQINQNSFRELVYFVNTSNQSNLFKDHSPFGGWIPFLLQQRPLV